MIFPATHNTDAWKPVVLFTLRNLAPDGDEVRFRDVLQHIANQPGFPGWDAWGTTTKRGKEYPKGQRAITLAAGRLKDEGMIRSPRRGYYMLATDESIFASVPNETPTPPTVDYDVAPVETTPVETTPVIVNIQTAKGVQFAPQSNAVNSAAYEAADTGLRRMAAEQARCFGAWSSRSDQCRSCPLAGLCQQAGMTDFAEIAAALDAATAAEIASAQAAAAAPVAAPVASQVTGTPTRGSNAVNVPFAVTCGGCSGEISAGSLGVHQEGRGIFHPACAE